MRLDWFMIANRKVSFGLPRVLAFSAVALLAITGCASSPPSVDGEEPNPIRAGVADEQPYSGMTADGKVTGLAPDIASIVFEMMDRGELEGAVATYADLIPGLNAKRWDIIAASLHISAPRCEQVLFADPFHLETASFAVVPGNPSNISTLESVVESGQKIALLSGSFLIPLVKSYGVLDSQVVEFPDGQGAIEGLTTARVDAFLSTSTAFPQLAKVSGVDFDVIGPIDDVEPSGSSVAFRKGDEELRDEFNEKLREMKASGELNTLLEKWGFSPFPEEHLDYTYEDACKVPF